MTEGTTYYFNSPDKSQIISLCSLINLETKNEMTDKVAFWDTGSTVSAISERVVDFLKIKPIDKNELKTASGAIPSFLYELGVYLKFENGQEIEKKCKLWSLASDKLSHCDLLIGMDIISKFDFEILPNKQGLTVNLTYPPRSLK